MGHQHMIQNIGKGMSRELKKCIKDRYQLKKKLKILSRMVREFSLSIQLGHNRRAGH